MKLYYKNMISTKIKKIVCKETSRISWHDYFMSIAIVASSRSSCDRLHVGCVIVNNDNRIVSIGYNGHLAGFEHKSYIKHNHEQNTIHAEQNAIIYAAKSGTSIDQCKAYVTHFPCYHCAKMLIASGIKNIYYHEDYKNDKLVVDICKKGCVSILQINE